MLIIAIILLVISFIIFIINLLLVKKNSKIYAKIEYCKRENEKDREEINNLYSKIDKKKKETEQLYEKATQLKLQHEDKQEKINEQISKLTDQKIQLLSDIEKEKAKINTVYEQEKKRLDEALKDYQENYYRSCEQYGDSLEKAYVRAEKDYHEKIGNLEKEHAEAAAALKELKELLSAGMQAQLREKEKEENLNFYKLHISDKELNDIKLLEDIKPHLSQPTVLSKVIWSTYFQKQTTELCNRVLGVNTVTGIYLITDLISKQIYVGQSTDIASRFKQHIKCGLGIDTPATNKLYNYMQKDGVWNFTFELIEKCSRDQLNEREKFWIETYQSNIYGLNITRGNK